MEDGGDDGGEEGIISRRRAPRPRMEGIAVCARCSMVSPSSNVEQWKLRLTLWSCELSDVPTGSRASVHDEDDVIALTLGEKTNLV